jgi:hypothetical protein
MFLAFESLFAMVAFGGLFLSGLTLGQQLFFGGGLLLLAAMRDFRSLQAETQFELLYRSVASGLQALERSGGNPDSHRVTEAVRSVEAKITRHTSSMHLHGGAFHLLKYALWVAGGWFAVDLLLPHLRTA